MSDPLFNSINAVTKQEIYPAALQDQYFRGAPFSARLRARCQYPFGGGAFMQNVHLFAPMITGSYAGPGGNFNTTKVQTITGTVFLPKYYYAAIPEYQSQIRVINKGAEAVISLVDADTRNAVNSISARCSIALALHGQSASASIVGNRPYDINGWIEALNDGVTPGWDGSIFTSYGQQARNGFISSALNSIPVWAGTNTGATAPVQYDTLEAMYQTASIGQDSPDLGVCNKALYGAIKMRIQPMQRLNQERDPYWGVSGIRMNDALIMKDDYFPSLKYGVNDPRIGNYLTSTFVVPNGASTFSGLPGAGTTVTVGEVFCWFNMPSFLWRVSNDELYGFGMSEFIPAQDNEKVVATIRAAVNLQCLAPRLNVQSYGFSAN